MSLVRPEWQVERPHDGEDPRTSQRRAYPLCRYLVDLFCLGIKDASGPRTIKADVLAGALDELYILFEGGAIDISFELARELVFGAEAFARQNGFEPDASFTDACRAHLGEPPDSRRIRFVREGRVFYREGPNDHVDHVIMTLDRTVGPGRYDFVRSYHG